jgi:hypothetical protein
MCVRLTGFAIWNSNLLQLLLIYGFLAMIGNNFTRKDDYVKNFSFKLC